jgi:hypothetical protein
VTVPPPHKPPSLTRMSDEIVSLRASVNKLARAQTAPLSNVSALSNEMRSLSGVLLQTSLLTEFRCD